MKLTSIEIDGFKSLRGLRLAELASYNAIIGPNNSGKSSIAQALWSWRLHSKGQNPEQALFPPSGSQEFQNYWREHISPDLCRVALTFVRHDKEDLDTRDNFTLFCRPSGHSFHEVRNFEGPKPAPPFDSNCMRWFDNKFLESISYYGPLERMSDAGPVENALTVRRNGSNLASVLFYRKNNFPEVFAAIQSDFMAVFPEFVGIQTFMDAHTTFLRIDISSGGRQQLANMGDGVSRTLAWITAVRTSPKGASIFLEEPETGAHPSLQRRLKRVLRAAADELNQQLIVLTHSPVWADVDLSSRLYQMTPTGGAISVSDLESARDAIGSRPSDSGYADVVLNCEGETEAAALPLLFNLAGQPLASLGVYLRNLRGQGRAKRVPDDLRLTRELGQRLHLSLDWADQGDGGEIPTAEAIAAKYGVQLGELTLWARSDGTPGVFEDVFNIETLTEALRRCVGDDGIAPTEETLRKRMAKGKTDKALEALYHEATKSSLSKPELGRHASEVCVERGEVPQQVDELIQRLAALVE